MSFKSVGFMIRAQYRIATLFLCVGRKTSMSFSCASDEFVIEERENAVHLLVHFVLIQNLR